MITEEDVRRIEEELKKELEANGLSKRATFLHATLKRYEKQIKSRRRESSGNARGRSQALPEGGKG